MEAYKSQFEERSTREDFGTFKEELKQAKELYAQFKAKIDKALSFDASKLKMNELEDKKNQLNFIIENLEMLNDQV